MSEETMEDRTPLTDEEYIRYWMHEVDLLNGLRFAAEQRGEYFPRNVGGDFVKAVVMLQKYFNHASNLQARREADMRAAFEAGAKFCADANCCSGWFGDGAFDEWLSQRERGE